MSAHVVRAAGRGTGSRTEDRRQGINEVVRALAAQVAAGAHMTRLLGVFEERLAVALGADWVRTVRAAGAAARPAGRPPGVASVAGGRDVLFEVGLTGRTLDAWDRQLLETAAHVLGLAFAFDGPMPGRPTEPRATTGAGPLIGASAQMRALRERIERVALTDFTVLIQGESGTGKELVARQLHELSRRRSGPFVAVNCAALVETLLEAELFGIEDRTATGVKGRRGKFEHADGGTLFLDEVADLSMAAQAKLLRVIQDLSVERVGGHATRRLNVRIVAATNKPLAGLAERGLFRTDLYYRLGGLDVHVPPLRARREDILELAQYFLACHDPEQPLGLSPPAADALSAYQWPGNVRELQRTLEGAVAMCGARMIDLDDLPPVLRSPYADVVLPSLETNDTLRMWASRYARLVLARSGHNKRRACRALGISYHTLQAHLRYGVSGRRSREVHDDVA
ncbi:MAG TPA: sigma-54 dependent transcriptional regulator [Vicinamibacterales bacterium]|nr:sigma-54 dependent transcriptional regulator [Vicinamibacterales bacterium]